MKLGIMVGDTIVTESFEYEQNGNISNGKEAIAWTVKKMQIIYTVGDAKFGFGSNPGYVRSGRNISICYYLTSKYVLDYEEYFYAADYIKLYTGDVLLSQNRNNDTSGRYGLYGEDLTTYVNEKAGYRPELLLWTGIDTAEVHSTADVTREELKTESGRISMQLTKKSESLSLLSKMPKK